MRLIAGTTCLLAMLILLLPQVGADDKQGQAVMLSEEWHVADAFQLIVNRRSHVADDV